MKATNYSPTAWNDSWPLAWVPESPVPVPKIDENELERLKNRLLREALRPVVNTSLTAPLRRAANEAAGLAWLEPYPLLVFPTLFEELAARARQRVQKQQLVHARSEDLLAAAA